MVPQALAILAVLSVAGCYPHGGELGTDVIQDRHETDLTLTPDAPVAVRHLTFAFDAAPAMSTSDATIRVTRPRADGGYERPEGVSVSVRPDDPTRLHATDPAYEAIPGTQLAFDLACREGCRQGATIVVRSSGEADVDLRLLADLRVIAPSFAEPTLSGTPEIREDADRAIDGPPLGPAATAAASIELTAASPNARLDIDVHADGDAVRAAGAGDLVGSLIVRLEGDDATRDLLPPTRASALGSLTLGSRSTSIWTEGTPVDLDWLWACPATGDCDITIGLDTSYRLLSSAARSVAAAANRTDPPDPDAFRLRLEATAILEALDGRTIAPDAVSLTIRPTP